MTDEPRPPVPPARMCGPFELADPRARPAMIPGDGTQRHGVSVGLRGANGIPLNAELKLRVDGTVQNRGASISDAMREKFIDLLRAGCSLSDAARGIGKSPSTLQAFRNTDPAYEERVQEAIGEATDRAETVLAQCALNAKADPRHQTSLIFLLKNRRPKVWRDRSELGIEADGKVIIEVQHVHMPYPGEIIDATAKPLELPPPPGSTEPTE